MTVRHLFSFVFVILTAVLLSSCGGGGGGGGGGGSVRPAIVMPQTPAPVNVSFETDVQDATLEEATDSDKRGERAKDGDGQDVDTNTDVVVRDATPPSSSVASSGGLAAFRLPDGGCKVIDNGVYENYLVSYRQGKDGELDCESSCEGTRRAVVTQGYRILLCVTAAEANKESLVFKAGECKGGKVVQFDTLGCQAESDCRTSGYKVVSDACVAKVGTDCTDAQGFENGKCVTASTAKHCTDRGAFVLNQATTGCQTSGACEGEGYKVESNACVAKVGTDCTDAQGFENGKCVMASTAKHCTDRGAFILNKATTGCQTSGACEGEGYKVVSNACVAKVGTDCTDAQGFENGKCVMASTAKHCTDRGAFVLNQATTGCQTESDCTTAGYRVVSGACVAQAGADCTGTQGFEAGKCITATTGQHCQNRGDFVLNIMADEGCQSSAECTGAGYKVVSGACVASEASDCTNEQGFEAGKCITASTTKHCTDRGAFILNKATTGCQTARACTRLGYKVESGACVAQVASDCTGEQGFEAGKCITASTTKHCTDRGAFILNRAMTGCQTARTCTRLGYKVVLNACVDKVASDCTSEQGFESGRCITATTGQHCQNRGDFVLNIMADEGCQSSAECTTSGYKVESGACVAQASGDCTGTQGFDDGKCITATMGEHCANRGDFALNMMTDEGCQSSTECTDAGYKIVSGACVAKVGRDCTGEQGFAGGRCITASTVQHCRARGGSFLLNRATTGCELASDCTGAGYKIVSNACVVSVAGDCTGRQGFAGGRCITASTVKHCTDRGAFVLNQATTGCQTESDCTTAGYKVVSNACVASVAGDCTGEQGFHAGRCVATPQDARQCQAVGKVLQLDIEGCTPATACTDAGHFVTNSTCIAQSARSCTGEQGFHDGKCVAAPRDVTHCQAVGKVLKFHRKGCETAVACTTNGRKVAGNICVGKIAADCTGEDGLHNGKCVRLPRVASYCAAVGKVLQVDGEGCQSAAACRAGGSHRAEFTFGVCLRICESQSFVNGACVPAPTAQQRCQLTEGSVWNVQTTSCQTVAECEMSGYKVSGKACVTHAASECADTQGFEAGKCITPTTVAHCTNRGAYVLDVLSKSCQTACTGTQGLEAGKCITPTTATHCTNRGAYILDVLGSGCQTEVACRSERNQVRAGACVSRDSHTSCTGEQGFDRHVCIALPTDSAHCHVIDKVLQLDGEGCEQVSDCTTEGYKIVSNACVAKVASDCTSTQGLESGRCIEAVDYCTGEEGFHAGMCVAQPQDARHCQIVGKVLQFDKVGCGAAKACTDAGYKIHRDACVAKVAGDCRGEQGLHGGKCVAMPQDAGHCQAVGKVLQRDRRGCESARACTNAGYKVVSNACVVKVASDCTSRVFDPSGRCVTTPLSSPDAVNASFDEAFRGKRERPVTFCVIGSGFTALDMSHIGKTIMGRSVCRHHMVEPEQVYRAFVDTDYFGRGKTIPTDSIVAFTHAVDGRLPGELLPNVQVAAPAFADGGLNRSVLDGYKVFIPTGDNGHADFLDDSYTPAEKFRIGDALHFGDAFAVGRLNAAGDGRHATSNGCGGRSNCVLAHGNFNRVSPFDDEPFANSQAATTFVAASITRALSYASLETTIGAVNELFDAAKVDIDGVPVFHPFRLIDKARELAERHQASLPGFPLAEKFDEAFSPEITRTTDLCFIDTHLQNHYWSVNATLQTILSTQYEVTCGHVFVNAYSSDPGDTDYFGDNALPIHKIPVGAIVNLSIDPRNVFGRGQLLTPPYAQIEGYKFFISAGNGGFNDTPYAQGHSSLREAVDALSEFIYLSDDIFFIAWFDENRPSHYYRQSSHCGILPNCAAARTTYRVKLGNRYELFSGTSGSAPHVTASITRAMLNSPPDTPLDHVNDFFHGALDWNSQIQLFNPIKLIDLVRELWKRPRLTSDVTQVSSAYDEAFDGTYEPSPRSVTACAVGGDASTQGILSGIGGTHVDVCTRAASNTAGIRTAFVGLPQGSIVALGSTSAFADNGLVRADLSGYKVFAPTGAGNSADFLTDSSLYDASSVTRMQEALAEGNLFYVARLNDTGTGLHASSNGCGDEVHCVAARGSFTVNGVDVASTQAATAYVAASMARAFAHAPAGTPFSYINNLFRRATMRHGATLTADKYDRGIQVFNPFRLIDEVRNLRDRPLTMSAPNQIARAFDEHFVWRVDDSPRDTTLCLMGDEDNTGAMRDIASLITESLGEKHVTICNRDIETAAQLKTAVTDSSDAGIAAGSVLVLAGTNGFADNGLLRADLSGYKVFAPTGDTPEGDTSSADFLSDSALYDAQTVARMRDALAGGNLFYVARLNDDGTGLHATSNGCGDTENCVAARGSFTVYRQAFDGVAGVLVKAFEGTQAAATYVAASIARALAHLRVDSGVEYVDRLFNKAKMDYNGMAVFNPFRLMDEVRAIASEADKVEPALLLQNISHALRFPIRSFRKDGWTGSKVESVDVCYVGGTGVSRRIDSVLAPASGFLSVPCVPDSPRDLVDVRHYFGKNPSASGRPKTLLQGDVIALQGTVNGSSIFSTGGIVRADLAGYKVFVSTGDTAEGAGIDDFLTDSSIYDAQTLATVEDALEGDNLFFVARLNKEGNAWHATNNGCGDVDNCVGIAAIPEVTDSEGALAFMGAFMARAMFHTPEGTPLSFVNAIFNAAIEVVGDIQVFNPFKAIDAIASLHRTPEPLSAPPSASADKPVTTTPTQKKKSPDDIYQALMRAQYAAVGRAGVPTHMDDIRIDVTEFNETRAFTMPATSYRYRALPTPTHSPLFGMLGMVYREDARYPEVGIAFNDKAGRTFISASHYRSEDFFGAYGSGAFKFAHVDNYRVVGKHEVVAGLDVTLWGRCGVVREGGVLLDWQRGCDSGAGVSYAHEFMGGEMTWRAEGARFLGGSLSSSGRRYEIAGGATQGEGSVNLRFNW